MRFQVKPAGGHCVNILCILAFQSQVHTKFPPRGKKLNTPFIFLLQISKIFLSLQMTLRQKKSKSNKIITI